MVFVKWATGNRIGPLRDLIKKGLNSVSRVHFGENCWIMLDQVDNVR